MVFMAQEDGNVVKECFIPIFTDAEANCRFLNFNGDFWLNTTTELVFGVLIGGVVLAYILNLMHTRRLEAQWQYSRVSRSRLLIRDFARLIGDLRFTLMALSVYSYTDDEITGDSLGDFAYEGKIRLQNIREWLGLSTMVFPAGRLQRLADLERAFVALEDVLSTTLSDSEFYLRLLKKGEPMMDMADTLAAKMAVAVKIIAACDGAMAALFDNLGEEIAADMASAQKFQAECLGDIDIYLRELKAALAERYGGTGTVPSDSALSEAPEQKGQKGLRDTQQLIAHMTARREGMAVERRRQREAYPADAD